MPSRPATKPSPGAAHREAEVEPVVRRHRVEPQPQPVAAGKARRGERGRASSAELGAAVGDPDPAVDRQQVAPPGDRRIDQQPADAQPADVDVDVGEQRRVGIAGAKRGKPVQPRLGDVERADVDMVAEVGEAADSRARPSGARKKMPWGSRASRSCRVSSPNTEPSIRPTSDLEARGRLEGVDLADDVAAARIGVQPDQEGADQQQRRASRPMPVHLATVSAGWRRRTTTIVGGRLGRHQKACPIET